jgi:hypothetical protein
MRTTTVTPRIEVAIGREQRLYHAFVTTAPAGLDAPETLTLYAAPLTDVSGMAAEPVALDQARGRDPARLVLVTSHELAWQRARYRQAKHLFTPADPVLVGLDTLQQWLWSRIGGAPTASASINAVN